LRLAEGIDLEEGRTAPARVSLAHETDKNSHLSITIHEGRYRQVRRMCEAVGLTVAALKRVRYGFLRLEDLRPGEFRFLTEDEAKRLAASGSTG
jgi:23S rRNA pseudouridine2605 synthase